MSKQLDELKDDMVALSDRITAGQSNMAYALDDLRETLIDELEKLRKAIQPPPPPSLTGQRDPGTPEMLETIRALQSELIHRDRMIAALHSSSSWRITRPFRLMHRLARTPKRTTRDVAVLTLRWALTKPVLRRPGLMVAARLPVTIKDRVRRLSHNPAGASSAIVSLQIGSANSIAVVDLNPNEMAIYERLKQAIAKDNR